MERWARGPRTPVPPAQCGDADVLLLQAAARHQCRYLVNLHVLQFLRAGGDPQWLRGLDFIPPKLRNLNEINKILAHRPWLITKGHIEVYQPRTRVVMGTAATSMCSLVMSQGRCASSLLISLRFLSFWGA